MGKASALLLVGWPRHIRTEEDLAPINKAHKPIPPSSASNFGRGFQSTKPIHPILPGLVNWPSLHSGTSPQLNSPPCFTVRLEQVSKITTASKNIPEAAIYLYERFDLWVLNQFCSRGGQVWTARLVWSNSLCILPQLCMTDLEYNNPLTWINVILNHQIVGAYLDNYDRSYLHFGIFKELDPKFNQN